MYGRSIMLKKILVQRDDGGVSIVCPTHEATPETMLRDALNVIGYISHMEINDEDLPEDRTHRDAWTYNPETQTVDIDPNKI
jgi:hypothetical protein